VAAGAGASQASAAEWKKDGQRCPIERPANAKWRMSPDACYYVSGYGGTYRLPKACTEVSVVWRGREFQQRYYQGRAVWGKYILDPNGIDRQYAIGMEDRYLTNGWYGAVRVYCWHS
jgi:hypothetical protein